MKKSTKIVIAIALTLGIAGGAAAVGKHRMGDPARKADFVASYVASELQLDSTQEQALNVLKDQLLAARQTMKGDMGAMHDQAASLLNAESFDKARALDLIAAKTSAVNSAAPEIVGALGNFLDSLNAEQKGEISEMMADHHSRHGKHRR